MRRLKDGAYLEKCFRALKPFDKRCSIEVTGGLNRPPMERLRRFATCSGMRSGSPVSWASRWRNRQPAADRTGTSRPRWVFRRWMDWAAWAKARTQRTRAFWSTASPTGRRCWRSWWRRRRIWLESGTAASVLREKIESANGSLRILLRFRSCRSRFGSHLFPELAVGASVLHSSCVLFVFLPRSRT